MGRRGFSIIASIIVAIGFGYLFGNSNEHSIPLDNIALQVLDGMWMAARETSVFF
jgi:hypothetical protein